MARLKNNRSSKGFTLIEMLIAVTIFSFLAVISTQILALSLRGVTKSQNIAETRENVDNAVLTIDRLLKSAVSCTPYTGIQLSYDDQYGNTVVIACITDSDGGYIASNSARLTSRVVDIDCDATEFVCIHNPNRPDVVNITITGRSVSQADSIEGSEYTSTSRSMIRSYSSD